MFRKTILTLAAIFTLAAVISFLRRHGFMQYTVVSEKIQPEDIEDWIENITELLKKTVADKIA